MKTRGLAFRLALRLWLAGLLIFGLVAAFIIFRTIAAGEASLQLALNTRADALQTLVRPAGDGRVEMEFDDEITRDYGGRRPTAFFQLLDSEGKVIEQSDFAEAMLAAAAFRPPAQPGYLILDSRTFHCLLRPLPPGVERQGGSPSGQNEQEFEENGPQPAGQAVRADTIWLVVGIDRTDIVQQIHATVWLTLAATGIGLLLLCLLAWLLVRHALRPLTELRAELARADEHNLAPVTVQAPDEIGAVIGTLNRLIGQLAAAFTRERAFTADAAHELRTPIAELRLVAEIALRRPALAAAERRDYTAILATSQRMQELVEKLLLLARAEAGMLRSAVAPVLLAPLLEDILAAHLTTAARRRLTVQADIPPAAAVHGDAALLRIIIDNLVGNAMTYATEGSAVGISTAANSTGTTVTVTNASAGLAAHDCVAMFDRFWRHDAARTAGAGHGLGLALARGLAELLGGTLTADTPATGTIRFTLSLPAAATGIHPQF